MKIVAVEPESIAADLGIREGDDRVTTFEDRFVIPTTHREYAENAFNVRGGCGFSFGNGCSEGISETSLFGSEKKRTIPIKATV